MHFVDLPGKVQEAVRSLGETARSDGVTLFVFGSFARGDARPNSDLDIGYRISPQTPPASEMRLRKAIEQLPTIRPVDLVDFGQVSPVFRDLAGETLIQL